MGRIFFLLLIPWSSFAAGNNVFELLSPSGRLEVKITTGDVVTYSLYFNDRILISPSEISLRLSSRTLGRRSILQGSSARAIRDTIAAVIPLRRKYIPDIGNEITLRFREGFSIIFRAYDDAMAWRFKLDLKDSIEVLSEQAEFKFPENFKMYIPVNHCREEVDCFHSSYEENYTLTGLDELDSGALGFLPVVVNAAGNPKILITESDLLDYPGMWMMKNNRYPHSLKGVFPQYPKEEKVFGGEYKQWLVTKRADFLARTTGSRTFPWRVIAVAPEDKDLLNNDIVYKLASGNKLKDISWIRAGMSTDEWIVSRNFFGVDFKTGFNTATYKYMIDFASRFGLRYVIFDAGWSDLNDLMKVTSGMDLSELIQYADKRNIGIFLWCLAMTVERQKDEAFAHFRDLGVKGVLVDFMDRDDQETVNFYEKALQTAAADQLMVSFHGAYKDTGLTRTYPNNITREAVLGHEYNMWSDRVTPEHDVLIGYIRNFAGPMDYEGGCMNNAARDQFRMVYMNPMSQGTRVHQLAQYITYISPLQVIAGNFSEYFREPEYANIAGKIPASWDETIPLAGLLGQYMLVARRCQGSWYVGGITDWNSRDLEFPLNFLGDGTYRATIVSDGINADTYGADYKISTVECIKSDTLKIHMAPGGGWVSEFLKK